MHQPGHHSPRATALLPRDDLFAEPRAIASRLSKGFVTQHLTATRECKHSPDSATYFTPRYIRTRAEASHRRTRLGKRRSVLAPFPRWQHTSPPARRTSRTLTLDRGGRFHAGHRGPPVGLPNLSAPLGHRGFGGQQPGTQGLWEHSHQQPRCALRLPTFISTALSPAPPRAFGTRGQQDVSSVRARIYY